MNTKQEILTGILAVLLGAAAGQACIMRAEKLQSAAVKSSCSSSQVQPVSQFSVNNPHTAQMSNEKPYLSNDTKQSGLEKIPTLLPLNKQKSNKSETIEEKNHRHMAALMQKPLQCGPWQTSQMGLRYQNCL